MKKEILCCRIDREKNEEIFNKKESKKENLCGGVSSIRKSKRKSRVVGSWENFARTSCGRKKKENNKKKIRRRPKVTRVST